MRGWPTSKLRLPGHSCSPPWQRLLFSKPTAICDLPEADRSFSKREWSRRILFWKIFNDKAGARFQRARKEIFLGGVRPSALAGEGSPRFGLHWEN